MDKCPCCGYCPNCGRRDAAPLTPRPYVPWHPLPYWSVIPPYTTGDFWTAPPTVTVTNQTSGITPTYTYTATA